MSPDAQLILESLSPPPPWLGPIDRIDPLAGDVSSRRYLRIVGKMGTAVATLYPDPFYGGAIAAERLKAMQGMGGRPELSWANDPNAHLENTAFLAEHGVPVPEILHIDGERGLMIQEDLGDELLLTRVAGAKEEDSIAWYLHAVEVLLKLQKLTGAAQSAGGIAQALCLDGPKLWWEMDYFLSHFWGQLYPDLLPRDLRGAVNGELVGLCREVAKHEKALCHRDYHARNLMVSSPLGGQALTVIDHQDARMGPRTYDIVSLLEDPYASPSEAVKEAAWAHFVSGSPAQERALGQERDLVAIQRLLKAAGTYSACTLQGRGEEYFPYLAPTLFRVRQLLEPMNGYPALKRALEVTCHG